MFLLYLDWCKAEEKEEEKYIGKLKYNITRASSSPVSEQCPNNKYQRIYRYCLENFPNKSEWSKVTSEKCRHKVETTSKLKTFNQVQKLPPKVLCNKRCFKKLLEIHRKTPV